MREKNERLRAARIAAGFTSAAKAAAALGMKSSSYTAHENGQNSFDDEQAEIYGRKFDVHPFWLLSGDPDFRPAGDRPQGMQELTLQLLREQGRPVSDEHRGAAQAAIALAEHFMDDEVLSAPDRSRVPIVGYVGAGAEIFPAPSDAGSEVLEEVEIDFPTRRGTAAAIVRGDSMLPVFEDGDLVGYYRDGYDIEQMIGRQCVVKLADGRMFIKTIKASRFRGLYTLTSFNSRDIEDVEIDWAAPFRFRISRFDWRSTRV